MRIIIGFRTQMDKITEYQKQKAINEHGAAYLPGLHVPYLEMYHISSRAGHATHI